MGTVYIIIDKLLEQYLRKEFNSPKGSIVVTRDNPLGKFITCHTRWAKEKPKYRDGSIQISIPDSRYVDQEYYYGFMTREDEKNVIDYIESQFDLSVKAFFVKGHNLKFLQKDIIDLIIGYFSLTVESNTYEMLKKRDFRNRKKIFNMRLELIKNS